MSTGANKSVATGLARLLYDGAARDPSAIAVQDRQDPVSYRDSFGQPIGPRSGHIDE